MTDPGSTAAEDRALDRWEGLPWSDGDDDGNPWRALEAAVESTRGAFVVRYQEAFRAGFRAGYGDAYGRTLVSTLAEWESSASRVAVNGPGGMQQAKHMADAACEALGLDYETTSPADIREAIAALRRPVPPVVQQFAPGYSRIDDRFQALEAQVRILNDNQGAFEGRLRSVEEVAAGTLPLCEGR